MKGVTHCEVNLIHIGGVNQDKTSDNVSNNYCMRKMLLLSKFKKRYDQVTLLQGSGQVGELYINIYIYIQ